MIKPMTVKQHTKFQIIPMRSFRVLADENFSNVDSSNPENRKLTCGIQDCHTHITTHSAEAAYQISHHSYKRLLRNVRRKLFWDVSTYVQSPINRKLTSDINKIHKHVTTHCAKAAYQISNHSYKWLLRNL